MHAPRSIQSPYDADDFWEQWSSATPRMCVCVKVTSTADFGSEVRAFTSNTRSMTLAGHSGVTFKPTTAIATTLLEQALDEATNLEFRGAYHADSFVQSEVLAGKWNHAQIEVFSVSWDAPDKGELLHFKGHLGEFRDFQTDFVCEARGFIALLSEDVTTVTSRLCRAPKFRGTTGAFPCNHSASTVTISSTAYNIVHTGCEAASSAPPTLGYIIIDDATFTGTKPPDGFFANGEITATSGANDGVSREIAYSLDTAVPNTRIYLKRPFPFDIAGGDTFTITAGCDHTLEMCKLYSNAANFRGEAHIPGVEQISRLR